MSTAGKKALIGRVLCGCPVACDMDNTAESRRRYIEQGYAIEVVDWEQVPALLADWKWPCVHEEKRQASIEAARLEADSRLPSLLDARGKGSVQTSSFRSEWE